MAGFYAGRPTSGPADPYANEELLRRHFRDIRAFVALANESGAVARVVPFEFELGPRNRARYRRFLELAEDYDVPVCSLGSAFDGHAIEELWVNSLDAHPNTFANGIAVRSAVDCLFGSLAGNRAANQDAQWP